MSKKVDKYLQLETDGDIRVYVRKNLILLKGKNISVINVDDAKYFLKSDVNSNDNIETQWITLSDAIKLSWIVSSSTSKVYIQSIHNFSNFIYIKAFAQSIISFASDLETEDFQAYTAQYGKIFCNGLRVPYVTIVMNTHGELHGVICTRHYLLECNYRSKLSITSINARGTINRGIDAILNMKNIIE
jgi:hypothetical protein